MNTTETFTFQKILKLSHKHKSAHLDIRIKEINSEGKQTIDLTPVPSNSLVLSICGTVFNHGVDNGGGQCRESVLEYLNGHPKFEQIKRLCEIWDRWHLNYLNAGTRAQKEKLKEMDKINYPLDWYTEASNFLSNWNLNPDKGYKFGHAWLYEPLPQEIVSEVENLVKELE